MNARSISFSGDIERKSGRFINILRRAIKTIVIIIVKTVINNNIIYMIAI